jgi:hypothetical protein
MRRRGRGELGDWRLVVRLERLPDKTRSQQSVPSSYRVSNNKAGNGEKSHVRLAIFQADGSAGTVECNNDDQW